MTTSAQRIYDDLGEDYDRMTRLSETHIFAPLRQSLLSHAEGEVLEVAVGTGKNLAHYPKHCEVTGLDVSAEALAVAKKRADAHGISFTGVLGDAAKTGFASESFDTIVCTLAGCTFEDPIKTYNEMRRVCRKDGRVLFLEHIRPTRTILRLIATYAAPYTKRKLACDPMRDTPALIEAAGLRIIERTNAVDGILVALVAAVAG
jgi:ubiquinone/menaquinone biosynthesis C-methylase UbiE